MEFLPHTQQALNEYLEPGDANLEEMLRVMGEAAARIVPDCVGLSLTLYDQDLTFTLVASAVELAELDAMQYLDGGPCVRTVDEDSVHPEVMVDLLDEERWALFARASAAAGVASSLSLSVLDHGQVVGGINLYASSPDAFAGHQHDLATALGASATGAVSNADLGFASRRRAELAPGRLRDEQTVDVATGLLAAQHGLDVDEARQQLEGAAVRAGITLTQAADALLNLLRS